MRDWDRNGKIDGRDYYLFHEEILKDHSESEDEPAHTYTGSSYRRSNYAEKSSSDSNKKEQKEIGCLPILLINIVLIVLLEILESL